MRTSLAVAVASLLTACATTYGLPQEERSRSFEAPRDVVWRAALASLEDMGIALVQVEEDHGQIVGRTKGSIWDLKGHVVRIVLEDMGRGRVRVEANAESASDDSIVDFGKARGIVRDFLATLDEKVSEYERAPRP